MHEVRALDHRSLHLRLKAELLQLISELADSGDNQLPPEEELSRRWNVSRTSLRSAAMSLQKDGYLSRIHGRGTFINRRALSLRANLTEGERFLTLLEKGGYTATHRPLSAQEEELPSAVAAKLELPKGSKGLVLTRLFEADGRPAVLAVDYIPNQYLPAPFGGLFKESVFEFAEAHGLPTIVYSVAEIMPWQATKEQHDLFGGPHPPLLLLLEHLHLTESDRPLILTKAYVHPEYIRFGVIRTRSEV